MRQILSFIWVLLFVFACSSPRPVTEGRPVSLTERAVYGRWNCYDVQDENGKSWGIPGKLLANFEQGFEFREQGVYMPRYFNGQSRAYTTNPNIVGYWRLQEEKYIYFSDRPIENEATDVVWEILRLEDQEFWLKDHEGQTVKMRKQSLY